MKYATIKNEASKRYEKLCDDCGVFWAFSNEQFDKNKTPKADGEKYTSIGAGGFMPSSNVQKFIDGQKAIEKWRKEAVKQAKADEVILSELKNYEAFYTGELDDAMSVLEELGYSYDQVKAVYNRHKSRVYN